MYTLWIASSSIAGEQTVGWGGDIAYNTMNCIIKYNWRVTDRQTFYRGGDIESTPWIASSNLAGEQTVGRDGDIIYNIMNCIKYNWPASIFTGVVTWCISHELHHQI